MVRALDLLRKLFQAKVAETASPIRRPRRRTGACSGPDLRAGECAGR